VRLLHAQDGIEPPIFSNISAREKQQRHSGIQDSPNDTTPFKALIFSEIFADLAVVRTDTKSRMDCLTVEAVPSEPLSRYQGLIQGSSERL